MELNNSCHENLTEIGPEVTNCTNSSSVVYFLSSNLYTKHQKIFSTIYVVIIIIGLTLNIFVACFLVKSRIFRNSASMVLLNLAITDCIHGLLMLVPAAAITSGSWPGGGQTCAIYSFLFQLVASVSLNQVAVVALERYISVVKNQHGHMVRQKWRWAIMWVWLMALAESVPPLLGWSSYQLYEQSLVCSLQWQQSDASSITYIVCYLIFGVAAPMSVQVFCYCKIYTRVSTVARRVRYSRMSMTAVLAQQISRLTHTTSEGDNRQTQKSDKDPDISRHNSSGSMWSQSGSQASQDWSTNSTVNIPVDRRERHEQRLARTMAITLLGTVISWGPYFLSIFAVSLTHTGPNVIALTVILASLSTIYNPIFYVILNRSFRDSLRRTMPFRSTQLQTSPGRGPIEDLSHNSVSVVPRTYTENKTSVPSLSARYTTTWCQRAIEIQTQEGVLDTITEMSTPMNSPADLGVVAAYRGQIHRGEVFRYDDNTNVKSRRHITKEQPLNVTSIAGPSMTVVET